MHCNEIVSPCFFVLCGPTGSGKTDLSYQLAERFSFEIVNGDVGQFYEPLTIGTAKPAWQKHQITHHLFDSIKEPKNLSVVEYRVRMQEVFQDIWKRKKIPLIVGGSLFYIRSLFFPPLLKLQQTYSQKIETKSFKDFTSQGLWQQLHAIDPMRAQAIDPHDRYRLERALTMWHVTGKKPSEQKPVYQPLGNFFLTYVTRDRQELYDRINQRVHQMMAQGWVHEISMLSDAWKQFLLQKKILGYDDIVRCLEHTLIADCEHNETLISTIAQKTRHYAKRQGTFWRSLKRDLIAEVGADYGREINLTCTSVAVYLNDIANILKNV